MGPVQGLGNGGFRFFHASLLPRAFGSVKPRPTFRLAPPLLRRVWLFVSRPPWKQRRCQITKVRGWAQNSQPISKFFRPCVVSRLIILDRIRLELLAAFRAFDGLLHPHPEAHLPTGNR